MMTLQGRLRNWLTPELGGNEYTLMTEAADALDAKDAEIMRLTKENVKILTALVMGEPAAWQETDRCKARIEVLETALRDLIENTRDMLFGPRGVAECSEGEFYAEARAALKGDPS